MKKYLLAIDTSASSIENDLFVYEAVTIKDAKNKLRELRLRFGIGYVYCATISKKESGRKNNLFCDILRTDNGEHWYVEKGDYFFNPVNWRTVNEWKTVEAYKKSV